MFQQIPRLVDSPLSKCTTRSALKDSARYIKIVEWSEADNCYVGTSPGLLHGGCHGDDEQAVFKELCEIIEETVADIRNSGHPLPAPTIGRRQDVA